MRSLTHTVIDALAVRKSGEPLKRAAVPAMPDPSDEERRLEDIAARLRTLNADPSLDITVDRQWHGLFVVEGLGVSDLWTDVFEPVRRRLLWSSRWHSLQSPAEAENAVASFLTERPDIRGFERWARSTQA